MISERGLSPAALRSTGTDKIWESTARLSTEIDILIGRIMEEWLGTADRAISDLSTASAKIADAVAGIKKQLQIAQNVVKVIGFLDEAVAIAKKAFLRG